MRVIEDNQDKMPEGEYLMAMNALGALHREIPVRATEPIVAHIPVRPQPTNDAFTQLFIQPSQEFLELDQNDQVAWRRVKLFQDQDLSLYQWLAMSQQERDNLNRQSIEAMIDKKEATQRNPDPSWCPFIARHSISSWRFGTRYENNLWSCVCGYRGKTKKWEKHEQSERHQNWSKHRFVSRRIIEKMKKYIADDEVGEFIPYNPYSTDHSGVRCFTICQERNEWTHPELFLGKMIDQVSGKWFVHNRDYKQRQYE
jgi:hypothetical protein